MRTTKFNVTAEKLFMMEFALHGTIFAHQQAIVF
jgi:hypothetical protein